MKTAVYVDGMNLYYGALHGTPFRWLDLPRLCQLLLPGDEILHVSYYTARINSRASAPDAPRRQDTYLRALRARGVEVVLGHFLTTEVTMPVASPKAGQPKYIRVIKSEEKGSDVNLASRMVRDGFMDRYEAAVIMSNDSDLLEPIRIVRYELGKVVGVLNPHVFPSRELTRHATFLKPVREGVLAACQLPQTIHTSSGWIRKPEGW